MRHVRTCRWRLGEQARGPPFELTDFVPSAGLYDVATIDVMLGFLRLMCSCVCDLIKT